MTETTEAATVTSSVAVEFADAPTLGALLEGLTRMRDGGAPLDAELVLSLGDKGNQRDPWTYLRGLTARWQA